MPPLSQFSKTVFALAMSQAIAMPAMAANLVVNDSDDVSATGDGMCTLREAIVSINNSVHDTDCSAVAPGSDDFITFDLPPPFDPAFPTRLISLSQANPLAIVNNPVRIDGYSSYGGVSVEQTTPNIGVLEITNSPGVSLERIGLQGGSGVPGAGLRINNSTVSMYRANITNNDAGSLDGGGMKVENNSFVTVDPSGFSGNSARNGAGVHVSDSIVTLNGASLGGAGTNRNTASLQGGGLYSINSTVTLSNGYIGNNVAINGAGAFVSQGSLLIDEGRIPRNVASDSGGAFFVSTGGVLNIEASTVWDNTATNSGGAVTAGITTNVSIENSSLRGNRSYLGGGAIYVNGGGEVAVSNSTINRNMADGQGGGIFANNNGTISLTNATVTDNAATDGGGVHIYVNAVANISNSIVVGNEATNLGEEIFFDNGGSAQVNFNSINVLGHDENTNAESFFAVVPTAPQITATSDGNTATPLPDIFDPHPNSGALFSEFHLLEPNSPAIGVASEGLCPPSDQRGVDRNTTFLVPIVASNNKVAMVDMGGECDVGAIEFEPNSPP